ncbi:unnamed protein product, partial [Didymodactylos carnosus]
MNIVESDEYVSQFVHLKMMAIEKCCNLTDLSRINQSQWLICDVLLRDCEAEEDVISVAVANINVLKHINLTKVLMEEIANLTSANDSDGSVKPLLSAEFN